MSNKTDNNLKHYQGTRYNAVINPREKRLTFYSGKYRHFEITFNRSVTLELGEKDNSFQLKCRNGKQHLRFNFKKSFVELVIVSSGNKLTFPGRLSGNFREFYNWTPVTYTCAVPKHVPINFRIGSRSPFKEGIFPTYAGKFVIPPYLLAVNTGNTIFGIGCLEPPESEYALSGELTQKTLKLHSLFNRNTGASLRLGIFFSESREAIASAYRRKVRLRQKKYPLAAWWNEPWYDTYFDQVFELMQKEGESNCEYGAREKCTGSLLSKAVRNIEKNKFNLRTIVIGMGWSLKQGDFNIKPDLLKAVKRYQAKGYRIIFSFHPYLADKDSRVYKNNPDYFVHTESGKEILAYHYFEQNKDYARFDYTNPGTRAYLSKNLSYLFKELNIEGIKLEQTSALPPVNALYFQPSWGLGEVMQKQVLEFIFQTVKQLKRTGLVILPSLNPLFSDVCDVQSLGNRHFYDESVDDYGRRAQTGLELGINPLYIDESSGFTAHTGPHLMEKCIYGVPSLSAVIRRAATRIKSKTFTAGYPLDMTREEANLINSIFSVYRHSRLDIDDLIYCENEDKIFYRKNKSGPLKGFYSATLSSGSEVLVAYENDSALLCSSNNTKAVIAIPPGKKITAVVKITRNGKETNIPFAYVPGEKILLKLESSRGNVRNYRINYSS
ncbi:MAG: hypothetical protein GXO98_07475 [Nitrospirae bacterium]|nr:hypothetical protein [Nitrospirota bacterium]